MRIALATTFFGAHRFGGDAAYVERLAEALLAEGHAVEVFYSRDAFEVLRGRVAPLPYTPPPGLQVHPLSSRHPRWAMLRLHQTGGLGPYAQTLVTALCNGRFDVIHYHNVSLLGGAGLLALPVPGAVRLLTAHDHWLTCPLSVRWRFDREECARATRFRRGVTSSGRGGPAIAGVLPDDEMEAAGYGAVPLRSFTCHRCMLAARRPPQWWRHSARLVQAVASLDGLIYPSRHARQLHRAHGIRHSREYVLPHFLPNSWQSADSPMEPGRPARCVFIGRLVKAKGLHDLLPEFREGDGPELEIIGDGPAREELERLARGSRRIRFVGAVAGEAIRSRLRGATALLSPSRLPETFGYVAVEAWSQAVPVLASEAGALPEVLAGGGGHVCRSPAEFHRILRRWSKNPDEARAVGLAGWRRLATEFTGAGHLHAWHQIVAAARTPLSDSRE